MRAVHTVRMVTRYTAATLAALLGSIARPVSAQDIEAVAGLRGIPLPSAYYEAVRRNPLAFELPNGLFRSSPEGPQRVAAVTGTVRIPVVLALFADSPEPHIRAEEVRASLFDGPTDAGTLTASYEEMSRGRFRVVGDVLPWVRTATTLAQAVGTTNGLSGNARVGDYLVQALSQLDPTVDFGRYDSDGPDGIPNSADDDGIVDAVAFEFLEIAASCGGPAIWPHRSGISNSGSGQPFITGDRRPNGTRVQVDGYIVQSVADCSGQTVQTAATIAHEFGHVLGLPDFYHVVGGDNRPQFRRWVLGCWELMAAGSWGCGPVTERESFGPTHMLAAQKAQLGWLELETVGEVWDQEFVLPPVQSGRALRVPLDSAGTEALIIEYRTRTGFDRALPSEGVLITHFDQGGALRPRLGLRYRERLLEADWNDGLVRVTEEGGNRGEAGDAFGGGGGISRLNAFTNPPLLRQATGGSPSNVAIHSITVAGGQARIRLSNSRTPRVILPATALRGTVARSLDTHLRIAGGMMPYSVVSVTGGPPGLEVTALEDDLHVRGMMGRPGSFQMIIRLGDSRGSGFEALVPVTVENFVVEQGRLLQGFLRSGDQPLAPNERGYLDQAGNANGALDVGDVRAWLLGQP